MYACPPLAQPLSQLHAPRATHTACPKAAHDGIAQRVPGCGSPAVMSTRADVVPGAILLAERAAGAAAAFCPRQQPIEADPKHPPAQCWHPRLVCVPSAHRLRGRRALCS